MLTLIQNESSIGNVKHTFRRSQDFFFADSPFFAVLRSSCMGLIHYHTFLMAYLQVQLHFVVDMKDNLGICCTHFDGFG
jgi:hypothetical protein